MKKWGLGIFLSVLLCLPGCSGLISTPGDMMKRPGSESGQAGLRAVAEEVIPEGAQLTIPLQPEDMGAIRQVDIAGDGEKELIAFYKKEYQLGAVVLRAVNDKWEKIGDIEGLGQDIAYADFKDLDNDSKLELMIGWSGGQGLDGDLDIYTWQDSKLKLSSREKYTEMAVGDLDGDLNQEIITLVLNKIDPANQWAKAYLYEFNENELKCMDKYEMDGYIGAYTRVCIGNVSKERKAVFIDMGVGAHSAYTDILVLEAKHLQSILTDEKADAFEKTFKPYPSNSEDINNDNIIEVGLFRQPPGYEEAAMVEIPWIETWYQWDGKTGLKKVGESRWDYFGGYRFTVPEKWEDRFTLKKEIDSDDREQAVIFYYIGHSGKERAELLKIYSFENNLWAEKKEQFTKNNPENIILSDSKGKVNVGVLPSGKISLTGWDLSEYKRFLLTETEFKEYFHTVEFKWQ